METATQSAHDQFKQILKKKGIGPEGSKSLSGEECTLVENLFLNEEVSPVTRATMLTALLLLAPNPYEKDLVLKISSDPDKFLPRFLADFLMDREVHPLLKLIKKLINLENLAPQESEKAMQLFFDPETPAYLQAAFLEAERLKRETFSENNIIFTALWNKVDRHEIHEDPLIDLADSYDSYNRHPNLTPFIACTLAAMDYPVIVHGIDQVAPKEGITSHQILKASNKNPLFTQQEAVHQIQNPDVKWAYIDQQIYAPELHKLQNMRREMVKRPALATFEKLLQPVQSIKGNLIVTGYTHPHYKTETVEQIKEMNEAKKALVLKGCEGSILMRMSKSTTAVLYDGDTIAENEITPGDFYLDEQPSLQNSKITVDETIEMGLNALKGEKNAAYYHILYTASVILSQFGLEKPEEVTSAIQEKLDNGEALKRWEFF